MSTTLRAALDWLFGLQNRGAKLGLANIAALLRALSNPQEGLHCIHVAGTNGKGSVCAFAEAAARAGGLRTGLFTSPHLVRFNERIQVAGQPISDAEIVEGLQLIRAQAEVQPATFFEVTTTLAFWYFQRRQVELAVLETGLGGRLDATNVVQPAAAVITAIDYDHQAILGWTLASIAFEKAGIIKPGRPVVSGPQPEEVVQVLERVAAERQAPLRFVARPIETAQIGLFGSHQRWNAALAEAGLDAAGLRLPGAALRAGWRDVVWPGRFQVARPGLVLDGAHNLPAVRRLLLTWREYSPQDCPAVIFGGLADKDLTGMLQALGGVAAEFLLVPIRNPRAAAPEALAELVPSGIPRRVFSSAAAALEACRLQPRKVLVTGSLFLVGECLAVLEGSGARYDRSAQ